nr:uncharacterized protein CI109_005671 [Kwoniella shandongensis]KAA5525924.1 hypothetical protein CI109_005671 [Kwoniella shandongensis]
MRLTTVITSLLALLCSSSAARVQPQTPLRALSRAPKVVSPTLCPDDTTQYSGYLPGSSIFFWFFPSRSHPETDPVGIWSNGGPGSSALTGMQYAGPCYVEKDGHGGWEMRTREWSFNNNASILMIDNPRGAGFSYAEFPAVDTVFDSARDTYEFIQTFVKTFPEYASNPWAVNSLSYGGHYAPVYGSFIQHMNAKIRGKPSLWDDTWPAPLSTDSYVPLNLTSISVGNGWINGRVQYRSWVDFACGGAEERGIPNLATEGDCKWARDRLNDGEKLIDQCEGPIACAAAGQYASTVASLPYALTGLNIYDYRTAEPYDETGVIAYYNNATVQAELGVIHKPSDASKLWEAHSARIWHAYVFSGDWDVQTDVYFERLLRSGVSVLKYEGMVDFICNYLGVREIMANLPNYERQSTFNTLPMLNWTTGGNETPAGMYKCIAGRDVDEGNLCYVEIEGAGHVLSLDKPKEGSWMMSQWMQGQALSHAA